jgi:hypothetical protein
MGQSTYGGQSDQVSALKDKATDQFYNAADKAEGMVNRVTDQSREAGERIQ